MTDKGKHTFPHAPATGHYDALDEKFPIKGGIRYLYKLFPGASGRIDKGFGSVA